MSSTKESVISNSLPRGLLAAVATPVDDQGRTDLNTFSLLVDFVLERGVDGIVVGGATGEYSSFTPQQRASALVEGARRAGDRFIVVAGIGAQTLTQTLALADAANDAGCKAVLLPMPYFFRYQQDDLTEYAQAVGRSTQLPCLLYHLPSFTNGMTLDSIVELIDSGHFVGLKDSSGESQNLAVLNQARTDKAFDLYAGDDSQALAALKAGWNGIISGIACFLPELLARIVEAFRAGDVEEAERLQGDLNRVIEEVVKIPIPWAVRLGLEARGIDPGSLPLPLSNRRKEQVAAYRKWSRQWIAERDWVKPLSGVPAV